MAYQINYFGWNNEGSHDKVWGYVTVGADDKGRGGNLYNFWGKRTGKLAFKQHGDAGERYETAGERELHRLQREKARKGYREIPLGQIEGICGEGYIESFEKQLTLAKLFNNFRGAQQDDPWA